jgi:hypothetical protein
MSMIAVEPEALKAIADALRGAGDRLGGVSRSLADATWEDAGDDGVTLALHEFHDHWRHGLDRLAEATGVAGHQLAEAVRHYGAVEAQIAQATG